MPTFHLICGLPGSGKSTLAKELEAKHPALRLTPDEWMERIVGDGHNSEKRKVVDAIQLEIAEQALRLGIDVILESGFWSRRERDECRAIAKAAGATAKLYFLNVPRDELARRLEKRNKNLPPNTFRVTAADLDEWIPLFEAPTPEELGQS